MAYQFPNNPALGDVHNGYTWQGSYWTRNAENQEAEVSTPEVAACYSEEQGQADTPSQPIAGNNNTLINLTIPIDLGKLLHGADHGHADFDYIAPE